MKNENRKSMRLSYSDYVRRKKYYDSNYFIQPENYKNGYSDTYYVIFEKTDKEKLEGIPENPKSFLDIILRFFEFLEKVFHKIKKTKESNLDSKSEIPIIINHEKLQDKELAFVLKKKTDNRFTHFPELPDYEKIFTSENQRINVIESRQWFAVDEKEKKKNKIINSIFLTIGIFITFLLFIYLINGTAAEGDVYFGIVILIVSYTFLTISAFVTNKKYNSLFKDELNFIRSKSRNATSRNKQYLKYLFDHGKQRNEIHECLHLREEEIINLKDDIQSLNKKIHSDKIKYKKTIKEIKQKAKDEICDLNIQRGLLDIKVKDLKIKLEEEHSSEMKKLIDELTQERKKLTNENKNLKLKHQKIISNMKKEEKERMEKYKNDLIESAKKEMIKFRKDTVERIEDNIMDNVFNTNNEHFNESKDISHEEYLREKRQEEEKQKRDREDLEIKKQILNMEKSILDVKAEAVNEKLAQGEKHLKHEKERAEIKLNQSEKHYQHEKARAEIKLNQNEKHFQHEKARYEIKLNQNEKHFQHEKARAEIQSDYNQKLSNLELSLIKSITKLDLKIETGLVKLEKSISEVKSWAEINFNTMKMWVKEEVLRMDKNHLMIVNKMEEFDIRYKGDMRDIQQHFQEFDFKIDRVAFEAHERILALDYSVKNEGLRLDKKIDNEVLRLEKSDLAAEGLLANIQHNLEKGLLLTKMEQRDSEYRSDSKIRDLRSDTEKGFYKSEMEQQKSEFRSDSRMRDFENSTEKRFHKSEMEQQKSEFRSNSRMRDFESSTEKSFLEAKYENERKLFVFNKKIDKQLDSLSHKHDIEIKDISHLAELKGEKLEKIIFQKASDLRQQISEEKANNKVQWAKMDAKFTIQIKDMQTLHMKHLYEQDQKIMKVINKIESLHHDIAKTSVQMGSMKNDIEKVGIANDRIKQDANALLSQVSLRLDSIEHSFKLAKETSRLVEERIDTKVESDLLKLKSITLDQERKLQEIAFAEQGMNMLFDKYENRAAKKEQEVKNMNDNIIFLNKKIETEKKLINESGRLQDREVGMNNRMARLIDDRNDWKRDAEQSNRDANYYRKAAEHFRKKAKW